MRCLCLSYERLDLPKETFGVQQSAPQGLRHGSFRAPVPIIWRAFKRHEEATSCDMKHKSN
jgi:hypothetical protein